jgi:hypothetical protein
VTEIDWKAAEQGEAHLSPDRRYRYALRRTWDAGRPVCMIVGLNPSTADESKLDPTLRRCIRFAHGFGYGGFWMGNLFAFRSTDPRAMKLAADPVGPDNNSWLIDMARWVGEGNVIFAWGAHGSHRGRDQIVSALLMPYQPRCFGKTKEGQPKHPLYLPSATPLEVFA